MSDEPPLYAAALAGDLASVKQLVEAGCDINQPDPSDGNSPLHAAIKEKKNNVARYLLEKNCDMEFRDESEYTPFLEACLRNNVEMVQVLHERGANTAAVKKKQENGLHLACYIGHNAVVKYLLNHKLCSIEERDDDGGTSLHIAACRGNVSTVGLLLVHEPQILTNYMLQTPLDLARDKLEEVKMKENKSEKDVKLMTNLPKCIQLLEKYRNEGQQQPTAGASASPGDVAGVQQQLQQCTLTAGAPDVVTAARDADNARALSDQNLLRVAQKLGGSWKIVGGFLNIPLAKINQLAAEHVHDNLTAVWTMLVSWRDGAAGDGAAQVAALREALEDADRRDVLTMLM